MFAILNICEGKKGLKSIFSKAEISSEKISLSNGENFFNVSVEKKRGKIPWKKLSDCFGILREDVLINSDVTLPKDVGISKFIPTEYPQILFFSSVVKHITSQGKSFDSLCVQDDKGLFIPFVTKLLPHFSQIKIVTPLIEEYEFLSRELFLEFGISLLITDSGELSGEIVVSSDSGNVPVTFCGTLYTLHKRFLLSGRVLCPKGIVLPSYCKDICPEGVDPFLFAAALYEKCSLKAALKAELIIST